MRAFKKWDAVEYPLPPTTERGPVNRDMLSQRKHAWRAALSWLEKIIDSCMTVDVIQDVIEKELREEKEELN